MMNGMMNGVYGAYNSTFNGLNNGGFFSMSFSTLLLIGLVILAISLLWKNKRTSVRKDPIFISEKPGIDAAEIVRLRYARGEISLEEFQTILKNIQ